MALSPPPSPPPIPDPASSSAETMQEPPLVSHKSKSVSFAHSLSLKLDESNFLLWSQQV
ncbi:hypothetical protein A2U01_0097006, partial [Trifolium medium]|nr:hypothetical protein [Trifolium medium]